MSTTEPRMITVDHTAFKSLMMAVLGPDHYIRELQYTRGLPGGKNPIDTLEAALVDDEAAFRLKQETPPAGNKENNPTVLVVDSAEGIVDESTDKNMKQDVAKALETYHANVHRMPDEKPIGVQVGSLVHPKQPRTNPLVSGCGEYECAVAISLEPFVLVSLSTDMRWSTKKADDFFHMSFIDKAIFTRCLRRIHE